MAVVDISSNEPMEMDEDDRDSTPAIRIILADSQAIYRVGMRKVFALEDDIRVVAQAETLQNLYSALQRFPTDVVVLEGQLTGGYDRRDSGAGAAGSGGQADRAAERGG